MRSCALLDVSKAYDFAALTMGLKESGRIVAPDGIPVLGFFRSHTLYHCYGVARSPHDGLHHIQFTLKDPTAVYAAYDKMKQGGQAKLIWGPLRHGAGHNIAFYVYDYTGHHRRIFGGGRDHSQRRHLCSAVVASD